MKIIKTFAISLVVSLCILLTVNCGGSSNNSSDPDVIVIDNTPVEGGDIVTPAESIYPDYNTNPLPENNSGMSSNASDIANKIKLGWNIGNTMEATGGKSETYWGNPKVDQALIQLVKDNGFDAIRLPVSWDQYANQQTAEIEQAWLDRVKEVVQYCVDNNLYVLVNIHWDSGWLEANNTPEKQAEVNAKQKAYWQQIATHLRDFDEHLLFASANEPQVENAEQMAVLLSYHQTFVDTVRATGGKNAYRTLVVQGPKTDIETTNTLFNQLPTDTIADRMMAEVHYYTPYQFALMNNDESWGKQHFYWGKNFYSTTDTERNSTGSEEEVVDTLFALMKRQFVDQGIPVILGEFCATRRPASQMSDDNYALHLASRAYYHQYVTQQALAHGLMPFYWDSGALDGFSSGIFDRNNLTVFDQTVIDALRQGAGK